jgi:hypothetical protein
MGKTTDYHKMSVADKERHNRQHAPPTRCPHCDVAVQADDLVAHVTTRCPGKPELHPRSRWVNHRQALKMGVSRSELHRLLERDKIRVKGETGSRRYLLVDLAKHIAIRGQRRERRRTKTGSKALTMRRKARQILSMPKDKDLKALISAFVETAGSFNAASRKLDVPADTLRRAASGASIRKGTQVLIETQLAKVAKP